MSGRTIRTRLFAATTVAVAALALTACENGEGVRDEGPSSSSSVDTSTDTKDTRTTARTTPCTAAHTRIMATEVSHSLHHLLLTLTNTGTRNCDLTGYPIARFDKDRSGPPAAPETRPKATIRLSPRESGYAGVLLSADDGSGGDGRTARTLTVALAAAHDGAAHPALPAKGVHVDDGLTVTYWQSSMDTALTY